MQRRHHTRWAAGLLAAAMVLAACGGDDDSDGGGGAGQISVSGSSTVEPISSLVAEAFAETADVGVSVSGPGTGDGFEAFCAGETDISDASRPIKDEELESCEANGIDFVELKIGIDGIKVLTSPENDAVACLDNELVYALVGPESTGIDTWSGAAELATELGSDHATGLPDESLDITGPGEESGTYDTFMELTIEDIAEERGQDPVARLDYTSTANDNVIIENIAGSPTSLGWVGYAFFAGEQDRLAALAIDAGDGECVEPTDATIADGTYPLARPLFIYVDTAKAAEEPALADFVDFYLSDAGNDAVADAGYVQLTDEEWGATRAAWEAR